MVCSIISYLYINRYLCDCDMIVSLTGFQCGDMVQSKALNEVVYMC